ncbi:KAP family P-loop NTPase fold protein [Chryseobacterium gambrini]|uniref:KAP family P-loop domain-containing protein n=1 Tax=Chryseobacterium gambrini TaxID=373672 RepID=A0A1N7PQW1_9FLAO|nr:P-loop NTPase fold protein [Chryseobacterium gambrini]SIT13024.1 KAP family P-loop domain-containing protein [Chryseobacterium gambrini]
MWNDNESLSDYIDYSYLMKAVTTIIDKDNLLPCSIGIYGDWGSGKSSLMKMIEKKYENEENILVIKFNGWLFEGYEDAKSVLMGRIVDEIINKRTFSEKAIKYAAKLLKRIDWIKVAGSSLKYGMSFLTLGPVGLAGVSLADAMGKMSDGDYEKYIKERQGKEIEDSDESLRNNIQEFHKNFESLIDETKIDKIIVFIDDLDRCSPDTIIGTLEAIKLFLFTKKTAFVIGADERLIKYAVKRRFPELAGENLEIGRDYLEKLIQYPIRIPPLNKIELTTYVNLLFSQLYSVDTDDFELRRNEVINAKSTNGFDFALDQSNISDFFRIGNQEFEDAIALCSQIVPVLSTGLNGNPRQAKRFLNTLLIRISMASAKGIELKKRVLAKLMLLEYFKPETFTDFHDIQAENNGAIPLIDKLETITYGQENAESKDTSEGDEASSEEKILLEDNWIVEWIQSEPKLGKENLQPYFYFSRDKLTISAVNFQRMTPKAQETIRRLLGDSEIVRKSAIKSLSTLSSSEAASVFEALTEKVKQEENLNDSKAFKALFYLCEEKSDLKSQAITFLTKYPDHKLPLIAITLTDRLLRTSNPEALNHLFSVWSKSANENFAKIVRKKIK